MKDQTESREALRLELDDAAQAMAADAGARARHSQAVAVQRTRCEQLLLAAADSSQQRATTMLALQQQAARFDSVLSEQMALCEERLLQLQSAMGAQIAAARQDVVSSMPEVCQSLYRADLCGRLEQLPQAADLIRGMAHVLEKGSTQGRLLNATEKHFYAMLLNSGNAWVEEFVAKNMLGPSLSWAKRARASLPTIPIGAVQEANVATLVSVLQPHEVRCDDGSERTLLDVPAIITEDGSTCTRQSTRA